MEINLYNQEKHIITVKIGEIEYKLNALFSLHDSEMAMAIKDAEAPEYNQALGEIIQGHLQRENEGCPSIECIMGSEAPNLYIDAVLSDADFIREKYDSHYEIADKTKRFITAANDNTREQIEKLQKSLNKIKIPIIELPKIETPVFPNIGLPKRLLNDNLITPETAKALQNISKAAKRLVDYSVITSTYHNSFHAILGAQQSFFKGLADQIVKTVPKIRSLSISEERIEEIREAQRVWGNYGWTIPGHAEIQEVFNAPASKDEANKTAMKYCTSKHMESLFADTKQLKGVVLGAYEEAVDDFKNRKYRSCALVLFSLIDAGLIRMQRDDDRKRNGDRCSGKQAAQKVLEHYKEEHLTKSMLFSIFRYENLYACLMKVFDGGKDFRKQPEVINRNFLSHGMMTVRVRKRDCVQLFLLYYNWLSFLESVR